MSYICHSTYIANIEISIAARAVWSLKHKHQLLSSLSQVLVKNFMCC